MAYQVQNLEERTSKAGHLHYIISLNGHGNMQAYGAEHQMIRNGGVRVGDFIEFEKGGKDGNFANKIRVVDPFADDAGTPATQAMHDATRRLVPPSPPATANFLGDKDKSIVAQNLINRATEIYIHEAPPKFDPARLTEIATDVVGVYKEVVKQL